jgi:hypothetical protein
MGQTYFNKERKWNKKFFNMELKENIKEENQDYDGKRG